MADIILRNGWNQPTTYYNVSSVSFATENGEATYYEEGTGIGGPSVQSDWLQNNPTEADYIKNKPFGRWHDAITAPVTASSITESGRHQLEPSLSIDDFELGEKIIVLWHQILYSCKIKTTSSEIYIGNDSTFTEEKETPFHGVFNEDTKTFTFFSKEPVNGIVVGLFSPEETIHKIDEDFLPNFVPDITEDNLPQEWWGEEIPTESLPSQWWGGTIPTNKLPQTWWGDPIEGGGSSESFKQVQANWKEDDTESPAYIQHKPTIPKDRSDDIDAIQDELDIDEEGKSQRLTSIESELRIDENGNSQRLIEIEKSIEDIDIGDASGVNDRLTAIEGALAVDKEGNSTRLNQIDGENGALSQINSRLGAVDGEEGAIAKINKHLSTIDNEDETAPGRIQQLSSRLDKLDNEENGEIKLIKDRLDSIDSEEGRLDIVEGEVDTLQQILQVNEENKSTRLEAIDGDGGRLQQIDESLDEINDTLVEYQEDIDAIQTELGIDEEGKFTRLAGIEAVVEEHDGDITKLQQDIDNFPQSDWKEGDTENKAYIKNRPFYASELTYESNLNFINSSGKYFADFEYTGKKLNNFDNISIIWDDKIYNVQVYEIRYSLDGFTFVVIPGIVGNYHLLQKTSQVRFLEPNVYVNENDIGKLPFLFCLSTDRKTHTSYIPNLDKISTITEGSHTLLICDNLQKIPEYFLPDSVVTKETQSDWNETDSTSPAYIVNKPEVLAQIPSDWEQTNPKAADYIKNKPFGKEEDFFGEQEFSFTFDEITGTYVTYISIPEGMKFQNKTSTQNASSYVFIWDSEVTNAIQCQEIQYIYTIDPNSGNWIVKNTYGNSNITIANPNTYQLSPSDKDINPTLKFIYCEDGLLYTTEPGNHTFGIKKVSTTKKILDKQWLPSDIIYKNPNYNYLEDPRADWLADENSASYIHNKPDIKAMQDAFENYEAPVQSDWNAKEFLKDGETPNLAYIQNKPDFSDYIKISSHMGHDGIPVYNKYFTGTSYSNYWKEEIFPQINWTQQNSWDYGYIHNKPFGEIYQKFSSSTGYFLQKGSDNHFPNLYYNFVINLRTPAVYANHKYTVKPIYTYIEDQEEKKVALSAYATQAKIANSIQIQNLANKSGLIFALAIMVDSEKIDSITAYYLGNLGLINAGTNTGEKFLILIAEGIGYEAWFEEVGENPVNSFELELFNFVKKIPKEYLPDDFSSETINTLLSEIQQLKQQVQSLTDRVAQLESGGGSEGDDTDASVDGNTLTINGSVSSGVLDLDGGRVENGVLITTSTNNSASVVENNELSTRGTVTDGMLDGSGTVTNGIWEV